MRLEAKCKLLEYLLIVPGFIGVIVRPIAIIGIFATTKLPWFRWLCLLMVVLAFLFGLRGRTFGAKAWQCGISPRMRSWKSSMELYDIERYSQGYWYLLFSGVPYFVGAIIGLFLLSK
ncbi:MAG TPA: hypothetical protein DEQ84_05895 [Prevotellaceae bacterium]|nr:hypothetical protein [Prevotellaceae bacterium]